MRIACVGFFEGFGGAERRLIDLANELSKENDMDVYVININDNEIKYNVDKNVKIINLKSKNKFERYKRIKEALINNKINVAINFWLQPVIFIAMYAKKNNIKLIYSERGDPSDKEYHGILGFLRKIAFKRVNLFVFQTNKAKEYFNEKIQKKSVVIHNPIDIDVNQIVRQPKDNILVNVGRLHEQKNQIQLLRALKKLNTKYPELILKIYGEGPLENNLREYCIDNCLEKNVIFEGTTKNIINEIKDSTIFILSSYYEGMPNALLEAMAIGIPSITSNYSPRDSIYEFVKNGENALVYNVDKDEELIECIEKLLEDKLLYNSISDKSKDIIKNNSTQDIYEKWKKCIRNSIL